MSNRPNMIKFFEAFARIISEREGVHVTANVRLKDDHIRVFHTVNSDHTVDCVRYHRVRRLTREAA